MGMRSRLLHLQLFVMVVGMTAYAQNENIFPEPGPGSVGIGTGLNFPLSGPKNLLHLHTTGVNNPMQPVLRFSFGELFGNQTPTTDFQPIAQLALSRTSESAALFSRSAVPGDFVIRTASTAGRMIISTQKMGSPILFTTALEDRAPGQAAFDYPLVTISSSFPEQLVNPAREEPEAPTNMPVVGRLTTAPRVHLGVECANPLDAIQVGSRLTLHPGYNHNYIGYNQHTSNAGILVRSSGTADAIDAPTATPPVQSGHASGLLFTRNGDAVLYSAGENTAGTSVYVWQEPEWFVRGVMVSPDGLVGVGLFAPRPSSTSPLTSPVSRLTVRGPLGQKHSYGAGSDNTFSMADRAMLYSLRVMTGDASDIFCVREDRRIGIGTLEPRDILQIGNEIVWHDGSSKGFFLNAYHDAAANVVKNITGTRPSVFCGIDPAGQNYDGGFAISVARSLNAGQQILTETSYFRGQYRGLRLMSCPRIG